MCGRFALDAPISKIKAQFQIDNLEELTPRYNIPPGVDILFLCHLDNDETNSALWLKWGLVPFWAQDKKIGNGLINARAETVAEKPAFRESFKTKRGIVVMSGFFEWHQGVEKQPWYFKSNHDDLLAVAAIWDTWQNDDGSDVVHSCCLLTTSANNLMTPVHHRMPVILNKDAMDIWMDNSSCDKPALLNLLKPCPDSELMCYPVSQKMNNSRFLLRESIQPLA